MPTLSAPRARFFSTLLVLAAMGQSASIPSIAQSGPRLSLALETQVLILRDAGEAPASLQIMRGGSLAATGLGTAVPGQGEQRFFFFWLAEPHRLLDGDVIRSVGGMPFPEAVVPDLRADFDLAAGRLVGTGPASSEVRVAATYHTKTGGSTPSTIEVPVMTGTDGRFALALPDAALASGDRGQVSLDDDAGHYFIAPVAAFRGRITLGQDLVELDATAGLESEIEHTPASGAASSRQAFRSGGGSDALRPEHMLALVPDAAAAGDTISLTQEHPLAGGGTTHTVRVPAIDLKILAESDRVTGVAPPGAVVDVTLLGPDGTPHRRQVSAGPDGLLSADFAGVADIDRGWRADIEMDAGDGWRVRTQALVGLLHVEVDTAVVRGEVGPGNLVTILAFDATGREIHRWETSANHLGNFNISLITSGGRIQSELLDLTLGMVIGVDPTGGGDPTLLSIPELTAQADIESESIAGQAPSGHMVFVEVLGTAGVVARSPEVPVDADGGYKISFKGIHDVEPRSFGRLTVVRPDGHQLSMIWVALRTHLELDTGRLWADAPGNRAGWARLVAPDGTERGALTWRTLLSGPSVRAVSAISRFEDRFGRPVIPSAGDQVEGTIGDTRFEFTVPRLDAAAHVADDTISGATDALAGTPLVLSVTDGVSGSASRTEVVPAGGAFTFDLGRPPEGATPFDLRYNAQATLRFDRRDQRFSRRITVPGLTLDLGAASLSGVLAPNVAGSVLWRRADRSLGTAPVAADLAGTFKAPLRGSDGRPFDIQPGDELILEAAGVSDPLRMSVPRIGLVLNPAENALEGRVGRTDGDRFVLSTARLNPRPGAFSGGTWTDKLTWIDTERFGFDFDENPVLAPFPMESGTFTLDTGAFATAALDLASGHRARLQRLIPMLQVQHGGDLICGQADPDTAVALRLLDASGALLADSNVVTSPDGKFRSILGGASSPVSMQSGQHLDGTVGTEKLLVALPPMTVTYHAPSGVIALTGLPQHVYRFKYPAIVDDCWLGPTGALKHLDSLVMYTADWTSDSEGKVSYNAGKHYEEGGTFTHGLRVDTILPSLHKAFVTLFGIQAEVHLGTGRVFGHASPNRDVAARFADGNGQQLAAGSSRVDRDGQFTVEVKDARGRPASIVAGQTVKLDIDSESIELIVPLLDFDFSPASRLQGDATPGTRIQLTFRLNDGRSLTTNVMSDASGRFAFGPADIPRSETWTLLDVKGVRAEHGFAGYHRVVRDTGDISVPEPTPEPGYTVFLPTLLRDRSLR